MPSKRAKDEERPVDRRSFQRATERMYSALVVVEDAAWEFDKDIGAELLQACQAVQRALDLLRRTPG